MHTRFVSLAAVATFAAACEPAPKPAVPPPAPASVTIHARDYSFDSPPQILAGLTTFHLVNDGPGLHHALFVRLDSGKTVNDLVTTLRVAHTLPGWALFAGGPNTPDPGKESVATLDLTPGNYALICILDMPAGVPHYTLGMCCALTVTPAARPGDTVAEAPTAIAPFADNSIALSDMVFSLAHPITAGTHTFEVVTAPGQPHEVLVVQLDSGRTAQDWLRWTNTMKGAEPGHIIGGTAAGAPGVVQSFSASFAPGDYLLICLVPDPRTGKAHYMEGMQKVVTVR